MKITFEQIGTNQKMDNGSRILHSTPSETGKIYNRKGYKVDISQTVMGSNAYDTQKKTVEEVMQDASMKNVATERNYMAVMSGCMSGEDFGKLVSDGYQVGHTDIETVVSVVDKIKATMAQSGHIIVGYNDDLTTEELAQITGDISLAISISKSFREHDIPATEENVRDAVAAFQKAMQAPELTGGALKYMVANRQEPTIENIYLAGYKSVANDRTQAMGYFADDLTGYYGRKADDMDAGRLAAQMEKIIDEAGLEQNEETLEQARWLVENGAVLTAESLRLLHDLAHMAYPPKPEEVTDAIAAAIADGKKPRDASLISHDDYFHQAAKLSADVAQITDDAVYEVIQREERISLRSFISRQRSIDNSIRQQVGEPDRRTRPEEKRTAQEEKQAGETEKSVSRINDRETDISDAHTRATAFGVQAKEIDSSSATDETERRFLRAKRQLAEIRLRMTTETNLRLLRKGFSIDTAPLKEVVDRLKAAEQAEAEIVYRTDSVQEAQLRKQICQETIEKTAQIREMPVDTVGRYAFLQRKLTLDDIHERGQTIRHEYEQAGRAYESMMTAPRSDLGDSIGKAFRNVDFLLEDMGLEVCEANSRAVRILAYNQMPVNKESIAIIKNADLELRRVIEKLTPAAALGMVREGVNPLDMSLDELYEYLKQLPQTKEDAAEKFGKFIYKLDKRKEIKEEEREACIGVYRLIRQVEKGDFQALGAVVDTNQTLSLMNLLKAVRTRAAGHINHIVDDTFAGMKGTAEEGNLITQQIGSYYEKRIDQIYDRLEPEKLLSINIGDSTTVEELADALESGQLDEELERAYQTDNLRLFRQAARVSDETVSDLLEGNVTVSADYLLAADYLKSYRGMTMRRIKSIAETVDELTNRITTGEPPFEDVLKDAVRDLHEHMESREETQKNYQNLLDVSRSLLSEAAMLGRTDRMDVQAMVMYMKQMQFLRDMSREENYEIPLTIGDEITSVNLKIVHNKEQAGQVSISLQTMELSNVLALFTMGREKITGVIACGSRDGLRQLVEKQELLTASARSQVGRDISIRYVYTSKPDAKLSGVRADTDESVDTNDLYKLAKGFISFIKNI